MAVQSSAVQPERGAALILGAVLGLILAGATALAVGGWQVWRAQVATMPAPIILPVYSAAPAAIPNAPLDGTSDAARAPASYYPSSPYGASYGGGDYNSSAEEPTSTPERPAE